jgi:hypothetical protein
MSDTKRYASNVLLYKANKELQKTAAVPDGSAVIGVIFFFVGAV